MVIRALILALLPLPAFAGGLAPEYAPIERPNYAPIMEPVRPANICQHIPWTMCATGEPESRDLPETPVSRPEPETPVEKPEPEKPESPCKNKLGGGC